MISAQYLSIQVYFVRWLDGLFDNWIRRTGQNTLHLTLFFKMQLWGEKSQNCSGTNGFSFIFTARRKQGTTKRTSENAKHYHQLIAISEMLCSAVALKIFFLSIFYSGVSNLMIATRFWILDMSITNINLKIPSIHVRLIIWYSLIEAVE